MRTLVGVNMVVADHFLRVLEPRLSLTQVVYPHITFDVSRSHSGCYFAGKYWTSSESAEFILAIFQLLWHR
jgi:hypothetical protein